MLGPSAIYFLYGVGKCFLDYPANNMIKENTYAKLMGGGVRDIFQNQSCTKCDEFMFGAKSFVLLIYFKNNFKK